MNWKAKWKARIINNVEGNKSTKQLTNNHHTYKPQINKSNSCRGRKKKPAADCKMDVACMCMQKKTNKQRQLEFVEK